MALKEFLVLGAGITGLTVARELLEKGEKVTVIERSNNVGGLAQTQTINGVSIDYGPHLFHSAHQEIIDYWRGLVGDSLVEKQFYAGNFQNGKIFDYPVNRETIASQYLPDEVKIIEKQLSETDPAKLSQARNYHDYVRALAGDFLAQKFFTRYPSKLWGMNTKDLSAKFAPRRIDIREKRLPFHAGPGRFAGIIEGGCGTLAHKLFERIKTLGGNVKLNTQVTGIVQEGSGNAKRISAVQVNDNEKIDTSNCVVISTLPVTTAATLTNIKTSLYFRSILLVNFVIKGPDRFPKDYDWLYFDDSYIPFHRVGMQSRFSRQGIPDGHQVMCCEIVFQDDLTKTDIDQLTTETLDRLVEFGFIDLQDIVDVVPMDIGPVYPGYFNGYEAEYSRVAGMLGVYENLYLLGSLAEYSYADLQILTAKAIDLASEVGTINKSVSSDLLRTNRIARPAQSIQFGSHVISSDTDAPVFLIAEIGLAHNGDVNICKRIIDCAVMAGFNAVKIQTYNEGRLSKKTRVARYYEESLDQEESLANFLDKIIFSKAELQDIKNYCETIGVVFFSTPFDLDSFNVLNELGCPGFKISSMDIVNLPLIKAIAKTGKPIILSTGMASFGEIEDAIGLCLAAGNPNVMVLHCVSSYPCALEFANLPRIKRIAESFGVIAGYSDHTIEHETPALSVIAGARIVEKHVTLDKGMDGPDQHFSINPDEMIKMIDLVRKAEGAIAPHPMDVSPAELAAKQNLRRSIYISCDLGPGDMLTAETMVIKSPGDGIPARYYDILLGRRILRNIESDSPLTWDDIMNR